MDKVLNVAYVSEGSLITTPKGQKEISQLKEGDLVLTHENEYKPILEVMKESNVTFLEVVTLDGTSLNISPNELFQISNKRKGIFTPPMKKMASKLKREDFISSHFNGDGSGQVYYQYDSIKSIAPSGTGVGYGLVVEDDATFVVNGKIVCDNSHKVKVK